MPHIAEELWRTLGHTDLLALSAWPEADMAAATEETVTIALQVGGKLRATLEAGRDAAREQLEEAALANENVQRAIAGKVVRKVIVVPNRIVNVVV